MSGLCFTKSLVTPEKPYTRRPWNCSRLHYPTCLVCVLRNRWLLRRNPTPEGLGIVHWIALSSWLQLVILARFRTPGVNSILLQYHSITSFYRSMRQQTLHGEPIVPCTARTRARLSASTGAFEYFAVLLVVVTGT